MSALPSTVIPRGVRPSLDGRIFTDWFPPHVKPARRGSYPTRVPSTLHPGGYWYGYSYWTGRGWLAGCNSPRAAPRRRAIGSQNKEWRGLAHDPQ